MKFYKKVKSIYIYLASFLFVLGSFFLLGNTFGEDLMEKAFEGAMSYDTVIDIGRNKKDVGKNFLRQKTTVSGGESFKKACMINREIRWDLDETGCDMAGGDWGFHYINISVEAPLIVQITKFLLRMTIVLSISMVIFNSIKYMIEVLGGKDRKSAESKKNLIYIAGGIILALMSVGIINLIVSIPKSSLKTDDDFSTYSAYCKVEEKYAPLSALKKEFCEETLNGSWESSKCLVNGEKISISETDLAAYCRNELNGEIKKY